MEGDLLSPATSVEEESLLLSTNSSTGDSSGLEILPELNKNLDQSTEKKRARGWSMGT